MDSPSSFINQIPPITRTYIIGVIIVTVAVAWELVPLSNIVFDLNAIWNNFQIWRLVLPFFYFTKVPIMPILSIYMYLGELESVHFANRKREFYNFLGVIWLTVICVAILLWGRINLYITSQMYVSIITYILCRLPANESRVVTLYGFFRIPMPYLPFILTVASVLFKQEDWINAIITLAIAHVFYFLLVILPSPQYGGSDILSFMNPSQRIVPTFSAPSRTNQQSSSSGSFNWGPGHTVDS